MFLIVIVSFQWQMDEEVLQLTPHPHPTPIMRLPILLAAAACFIVAGLLVYDAGLPERADYTTFSESGEGQVAPEVGAIAPPFTAQTLRGETVSLDDLRGHPVIINFWATWCGPCRIEMPELQRLYEAHHADGLRILAVNLGEPVDRVAAWRDEFGLTFDLVLDPEREIARRYAFRDPPSTFIIAPDGTITKVFFGPVPEGRLRDAVNEFIP